MRKFKREDYLLESGKLMSYAFPGGYPIYYVCADNGVLCPNCANGENGSRAADTDLDPSCNDDRQWIIVAADCNYEDTGLYCDHCGKRIESAYCDEDTPQ
jgi:hypothetical protein